jgi:ADP-ribose pyrophosphatase
MAIVFDGRKFQVEVVKRRYPDGREHEIEVVRHPAVVVLIPVERDGRVVLIKQYRAAIERETWELPAGGIEPKEDADGAARRECEEEIGRVPHRIERLGEWYSTPGFCDELMIFYRVSDLREPPADSPNKPDDDELIEPRLATIEEARAMVRRGDIVDLKSAFALTLV